MQDKGDLPRSRALVAFDRNGFLLPTEPNTPAGSTAWRSLHFSPVLIAVGVALFLLATFASELVAIAVQRIGGGGRYSIPLVGTAVVIASYVVLVRLVERRRSIAELDLADWWRELGVGAVAGALLVAAIVLLLCLTGEALYLGRSPLGLALPALVLAVCGAAVQEIIMRGEVFRLIERLAGSWIALAVTAAGLAAAAMVRDGATMQEGVAGAVANGVLFAAAFMATRRLWLSIGLHIGWNAAPVLLIVDAPAGSPLASWAAIAVTGLASAALLVAAVRRSRVVAPAWTRNVARPRPARLASDRG